MEDQLLFHRSISVKFVRFGMLCFGGPFRANHGGETSNVDRSTVFLLLLGLDGLFCVKDLFTDKGVMSDCCYKLHIANSQYQIQSTERAAWHMYYGGR